MKILIKISNAIQNALLTVIGLSLIVIILVVCAQTFFRYVIFYSLPWSEELSRYLFVLLILLGVSISIGRDALVRMDLIDGFLGEKAKHIMHIIRQVLALVLSLVIAYQSVALLPVGAFRKSPAMQIPMHYVYSIVLISFIAASFCAVVRLIEVIGEGSVKE
jgi:TRAP-type C4-dicarboxylate transport system permease small subunit